jgi:hypothetical protein
MSMDWILGSIGLAVVVIFGIALYRASQKKHADLRALLKAADDEVKVMARELRGVRDSLSKGGGGSDEEKRRKGGGSSDNE